MTVHKPFLFLFRFTLALFLLLPPARAAIVIGSSHDVTGATYVGPVNQIQFKPVTTPQTISTNTFWPYTVNARVTNGFFAPSLITGFYYASPISTSPFGPTNPRILIYVPNDTNTYQFNLCANLASILGGILQSNLPPPTVDASNITNANASTLFGSGVIPTNFIPALANYDPLGTAAAATNGANIASGLSAYVPTNRFDAAGAAQSASNAANALATNIVALLAVANTVFLSTNGNDTSAALGRQDLPAASFSRANVLAFPVGGTVIVEPGLYQTNNILTNGVNYYFMLGATLSYFAATTNDAGWGLFDTRPLGATTNIISGYGKFSYQSFTGMVSTLTVGKQCNPNFQGAIVISNSASDVSITGESLSVASWHQGGWNAAVVIENCSRATINLPAVFDPYRGQTFSMFKRISDNAALNSSSSVNGLIWITGNNIYWNVQSNSVSGYGIWGETGSGEGTGSYAQTNASDLWVHGSYQNCKIYMDSSAGAGTNAAEWRSWITLDDLETDPTVAGQNGGAAASFYGTGKHYLNIKKIKAVGGDCIDTAAGTNDNMTVWLNAQKLSVTNASVPTSWIKLNGGKIIADVLQLEDLGTSVTNGILCSDVVTGTAGLATNYLYLTVKAPVKVGNGSAVAHLQGTMRLNGVTLDTSASNASGNWPVMVTTNGLVLQNCVLVAPTAAEAIHATNAQTVTILNGCAATTTNSPNITLSGGTLGLNSTFVTNSAVK